VGALAFSACPGQPRVYLKTTTFHRTGLSTVPVRAPAHDESGRDCSFIFLRGDDSHKAGVMTMLEVTSRGLAFAFLDGDWDQASLLERGRAALAHKPRWLPGCAHAC
jgi:hypothetical protein